MLPLMLLLVPLLPPSVAGSAQRVAARRRLQPAAAACCFADGVVQLRRMPICDASAGVRGVSEYRDLRACWEHATVHFGNTARGDPSCVNATVAETHPIFVVTMAADIAIVVPASEPPMSMDASVLPPGAIPVDERLSFQLVLALAAAQGQPCTNASIRGLQLELTDRKQLAPHPLALQFSGCGRSASQLHDLRLQAIGWGMPSFLSIGMTNASVLSIAPPSVADELVLTSLSWTEADLVDSEVRYFGDIEGNFGDDPVSGQNGSRAVRTRFVVEDPKALYGKSYQLRPPGVDSNYEFSWYGAQWDTTFVHIEGCDIE